MTKFFARLIAPMLIGSIALAGVGTAAAAPKITPKQIAGAYVFHSQFGTSPYSKHAITLRADHTGTDHIAGDTLTWKTKGQSITIVGKTSHGVTATFLGTVTKPGFNSAQHPGTITNSLGDKGTWYALKTG